MVSLTKSLTVVETIVDNPTNEPDNLHTKQTFFL